MDAILFVVDAVEAFIRVLWYLWLPILFFFLVKVTLKLYKNRRLAKSGITEIDKLNGEDFEKYLEILFRKQGYSVTRTPYQGDYGADLIVQKAGVQTVVQAKRYNRTVGIKAIQEAVAAKEYYQCAKAMVVSNNYYSQQAKKLATANHVELWDRDKLVTLLLVEKQTPIDVDLPMNSVVNPKLSVPTAFTQASLASAHCETCKKAVSPQVSSYCLNHPERFGKKIYCYEHQKAIRHPAKIQ